MKNEAENFIKWLHNEGIPIFELCKEWEPIHFITAIIGWYKKWVALNQSDKKVVKESRKSD